MRLIALALLGLMVGCAESKPETFECSTVESISFKVYAKPGEYNRIRFHQVIELENGITLEAFESQRVEPGDTFCYKS